MLGSRQDEIHQMEQELAELQTTIVVNANEPLSSRRPIWLFGPFKGSFKGDVDIQVQMYM